jgi:hypothetical protein
LSHIPIQLWLLDRFLRRRSFLNLTQDSQILTAGNSAGTIYDVLCILDGTPLLREVTSSETSFHHMFNYVYHCTLTHPRLQPLAVAQSQVPCKGYPLLTLIPRTLPRLLHPMSELLMSLHISRPHIKLPSQSTIRRLSLPRPSPMLCPQPRQLLEPKVPRLRSSVTHPAVPSAAEVTSTQPQG